MDDKRSEYTIVSDYPSFCARNVYQASADGLDAAARCRPHYCDMQGLVWGKPEIAILVQLLLECVGIDVMMVNIKERMVYITGR